MSVSLQDLLGPSGSESTWPEMSQILQRPLPAEGIYVWDYPVLACRAVGGETDEVRLAKAAILCLMQSIHLVDDMLDAEPDGLHVDYGDGPTANLALAFQALAFRALAPIEDERRRAEAQAVLARIAIATSIGQDLDHRRPENIDEEHYRRVVDAKGPPLFGGALALGAILGGADPATAKLLESLGLPIGRLIQASDDLADVFKSPAEPDWSTPWHNLALVFAHVVDHEERDRFLALMPRIDDPDALAQAQQILVSCGAVSYCCNWIETQYRRGLESCDELSLPDLDPLRDLFEHLALPMKKLLAESAG